MTVGGGEATPLSRVGDGITGLGDAAVCQDLLQCAAFPRSSPSFAAVRCWTH
jgi:hypothetical protein